VSKRANGVDSGGTSPFLSNPVSGEAGPIPDGVRRDICDSLTTCIVDEEILGTSPLWHRDTIGYARWALSRGDLSAKRDALDRLLNLYSDALPSDIGKDVVDLSEALYTSVLDDAKRLDILLPADWMRNCSYLITSLVSKGNYYGFRAERVRAAAVLRELEGRFKDTVERLERSGISPVYDAAGAIQSFSFDAAKYLKANIPLEEPATTYRAGALRWFKVEGPSIKEVDEGLSYVLEDIYGRDTSSGFLRYSVPYIMREYNGGVYLRADDAVVNLVQKRALEFEGGACSELVDKARRMHRDMMQLRRGISRFDAQEEDLVSEIIGLHKRAYEQIRYAALLDKGVMLADADLKPPFMQVLTPDPGRELEFELGALNITRLIEIGAYEKAEMIAKDMLREVESSPESYAIPYEKKAALLANVLEARRYIINELANYGGKEDKERLRVLVMEQLNLASELDAFSSGHLSGPEGLRMRLIAAGYRVEAYDVVHNLDAAVAATDIALAVLERHSQVTFNFGRDIERSRFKFEDDDIDSEVLHLAFGLAERRTRLLVSQAEKVSRSLGKFDEALFQKRSAEISALTSFIEPIAKQVMDDDYIARIREANALLLMFDRKWYDMAVYVRDAIERPFPNSQTTKFLRGSALSYIPRKLRDENGDIRSDLEDIDWSDIDERIGAALLSASDHLFDHPFYVQVGLGIAGCAVGSALTSGPWGCPTGTALAVGGDMGVAAATADETRQSFYTKYSKLSTSEAAFNYTMGAGAILLGVVGFKTPRLPLGRWGSSLGRFSTWRNLGDSLWHTTSGIIGGGGRLVWNSGRYLFLKARAMSAGSGKVVIDKGLAESAKTLSRILIGEGRDLGPIKGAFLRTKIASHLNLIRWDKTLNQFVYNGVGGLVDVAFRAGERASLPYLIARKVLPNPYPNDTDSTVRKVVEGIDAFMKMFLATRIGIDYLGIDRGGTRLMFFLDRMQDVILQFTSGKSISEIDWDKAAMNYITGSIPGQIRGRWLKNIEGKATRLTSEIELKSGSFSSGYLKWSELSDAERRVVKKLLPALNMNGVVGLKRAKDGSIRVVRYGILDKRARETGIVISEEEWSTLRMLLKPLRFQISDFSNTSSIYQYWRRLAGLGDDINVSENAKRVVGVLDKVAGFAAGRGENAEVFIRGMDVCVRDGKKWVKVGSLAPAERKALRSVATPLEYHPLMYAPGSRGFQSLSPAGKRVVRKLANFAGNDTSRPLYIQGGKVFRNGGLLGGRRLVGTISPEDEFVLREIMSSKFPQLSTRRAGEAGITIKVSGKLDMGGMLLFSLIHDTVIGTVWDEIRGRVFLHTDQWKMGGWTFIRSLTTLPPRELLKLRFGWDKKLAVTLDRLLGRNLLDPIVTKWINLWPSKAYWTERYDKSFADDNLSKFIDYHVAPGPFDGGLFEYNLFSLFYLFGSKIDHTPYTAMPASFSSLAEFYSSGKMRKGRRLTRDEYVALDEMVSSLLSEVERAIAEGDDSKFILVDGEPFRKDVIVDLGLGVAAAAYVAHQNNNNLFKKSVEEHGEIFEFVGKALDLVSSGDPKKRAGDVERFMRDVVDDSGSFREPPLLREYERGMR